MHGWLPTQLGDTMMRAMPVQEGSCTTSYDMSRWSRPVQCLHLMWKQKVAEPGWYFQTIIQVHIYLDGIFHMTGRYYWVMQKVAEQMVSPNWEMSSRCLVDSIFHSVLEKFAPPVRYLQTGQLQLPPHSGDSSWACRRGWKQPFESHESADLTLDSVVDER